MKNIIKATAIAALAVGSLVLPTSAVQAHTPAKTPVGCFGNSDYNHWQADTMHNTEVRAQVVGVGTIVYYHDNGNQIIKQYPDCQHLGGSMAYQIAYKLNASGQYVGWAVTELTV